MRKISFWAKNHKWPSRIIIVTSFIALNVLGIITGDLLNQLHISIPIGMMLGFMGVFLMAMIAYPAKRSKRIKLNPAAFYLRQKTCDFILAATTFCMLLYLGNHPDRLFQFSPSLNAAIKTESSLPGDSLTKSYRSIKEFTVLMKDENRNDLKWKERKKLLKEQIKGIKKANELSDGEKTLLVVLSILVALGLIGLITALACNLSCSGSDAAAVLVGIGGTAVIVYLLVITIRSIYGKRKKQKQAAEKKTTGS